MSEETVSSVDCGVQYAIGELVPALIEMIDREVEPRPEEWMGWICKMDEIVHPEPCCDECKSIKIANAVELEPAQWP